MRTIISLLMSIVMMTTILSTTISANNIIHATVTESNIVLNGQQIWINGFNIQGSNYFKLRDLAENFAGTGSQFDVQWNNDKNAIEIITGSVYTAAENQKTAYYYAGTMYSAKPSTSQVVINGQFHNVTAYNIDGNNYFQLRDLSTSIPYDLDWVADEDIIYIYSQAHDNSYRADTAFTFSSNAAKNSYPRWSETITSYIVNNNDHTHSVIGTMPNFSDFPGKFDTAVNIETYDKTYKLISSQSVASELPIFGGFLKGEKYNYIAYGQTNTEENDDKEVIRIVRYDKNYKRIDSVSIKGGESFTTKPFDAGSGTIAENGDTLVFHTSRERYTSADGLNHQSQLTIIVDTDVMRVTNDLGLFQRNHVSHSFDQYVLFDGSSHVMVDHGDAYPRSIVLHMGNGLDYNEVNMFKIPGRIGANTTGVSIGGFQSSADYYIVAMNSIDHSQVTEYTSYEMVGLKIDQRDIMISTVPKNNLAENAVKLTTLAKYTGSKHNASIPQLVKIHEDQLMVLWQEFDVTNGKRRDVKYVYIDGNGNATSKIQSLPNFILSTAQPVVIDNAVVWYTNEKNARTFYTIPLNE
jgi:hypothetical protein